MSPIVAGRFVANGTSWIDLASGEIVRLRAVATIARPEQLAWCSFCDALARLRHPCICPLVDYGVLDQHNSFEAYAVVPPLAGPASATRRLIEDAHTFLDAHGGAVTPDRAPFVLRATRPGSGRRGRALGVVLQERPAHRAFADFLDAATPGGPALLTIAGEAGSGLRTLRGFAARAARVRGYVPIAASVLAQRPTLVGELLERHVCVLLDEPAAPAERRAVGHLLAALGRRSTRRHAVVTFTRSAEPDRHTLGLGPLGVTAMTSMLFAASDGPAAREIFEAARTSEGKPGVFLELLGASAFEPHVPRHAIAREAAVPYVARNGVGQPRPPLTRQSVVLARAVERGLTLARKGRHAAALRILSRATRVLSGRGDDPKAALCAERLGWLLLRRGTTQAAIEAFERAQALGGDSPTGRSASIGIARAWIEEGRLAQAETLLRSLAVSATVEHAERDSRIAAALAECVRLQGRCDEALSIALPAAEADVAGLAAASRAYASSGATTDAVSTARRAANMLGPSTDDEVAAGVRLALAVALNAAGDAFAARVEIAAALQSARRARVPLLTWRIRGALLEIVASGSPESGEGRHVASRLRAVIARASLPAGLKAELRGSLDRASQRRAETAVPSAADIEALFEISHTAADETIALDGICASIAGKTRATSVVVLSSADQRPLGQHGRPWGGDGAVTARAMAVGRSVAPESTASGVEAAEPIRYGGEVLAIVAARWVPGIDLNTDRAAALLKSAALAAAAPVRGLLDRTAAVLPDVVWSDLLGHSPAAAALREATARAARAPFPVLIEGESGSGKELVARAIHRLGPRRDRRFCAINCAALSDDLLEAELFGHARGAFTGAVGERAGLFEEADGGTLFLDEVGELTPRGQAKLLRVLQEGEIRRVGENFSRRVDVRIVAATNRRLEPEVAAGRFRADLRFRLDVVRIQVPPLRERVTDVPVLAQHFWNDAAKRVGSRATLSPDAVAALARYDWPGNVRELQNVIAWIAVHSPRRGRVGAAALPAGVAGALAQAPVSLESARKEFERRFVRSALARANGERTKAAADMGVSRQGLIKMMRRLEIDLADNPGAPSPLAPCPRLD